MKGPKVYEQLIKMLLYDIVFNDVWSVYKFKIGNVLGKVLNLKEVPNYTTICKAINMLR